MGLLFEKLMNRHEEIFTMSFKHFLENNPSYFKGDISEIINNFDMSICAEHCGGIFYPLTIMADYEYLKQFEDYEFDDLSVLDLAQLTTNSYLDLMTMCNKNNLDHKLICKLFVSAAEAPEFAEHVEKGYKIYQKVMKKILSDQEFIEKISSSI